jgi:transaldolase
MTEVAGNFDEAFATPSPDRAMTINRLKQLHDAGVSIWLDYIDRTMLRNGDLARRIRDDALTGQTSNPTIFEKALAEGTAYDEQLREAPRGLSADQLFELVEVDDVRAACDIFRPVYDRSGAMDGFVSIEVSPGAANDSRATIAEARRLWQAVDRPNVMVKVPGTTEGAKAVRALLSEGININITLLFSIEAYERIIEAYLGALEDRLGNNRPIDRVASVASFFVSRVDTEVDKRLDTIIGTSSTAQSRELLALKGKAAVANAKLAYKLFRKHFSGGRWERLRAAGARVQRPLWASTGTKNPAYRDVLYVEELIGPDIVNTMPPATIDAFRDHGNVVRTVDQKVDEAERVIQELERAGISLKEVTDKLLKDGIASFQKSFDTLVGGLSQKTRSLGRELVGD